MPTTNSLVSQINHPELASGTSTDVLKFRDEYDEYKRKIDTVNANRAARDHLRVASVRECIQVDLLEALCLTKDIPNAESAAELTEDMILEWYNKMLIVETTELGNRVTELFKKHTHIPDHIDPAGGVTKYVHSIIVSLRRIGGAGLLTDKKQAKSIIGKLANGLRPYELRQTLHEERFLWKAEEDHDIAHFTARARELAVQIQKLTNLRGGNGSGGSGARSSNQDNRKHSHDKKNDHSVKRPPQNKNGNPSKKRGKNYDANGNWISECLNPKCEKIHKIQDCEETSDDLKRTLLRDYSNKMKENSKRRKVNVKSCSSYTESNNITVIIEGINAAARDDTGADLTVIPRSLVTDIMKKSKTIAVKSLNSPI